MEAMLTKEQPLKLRDRLSTKVAAGGLAVTALMFGGVQTYDHLRDNDVITPIGWHDGQAVQVVEANCNTLVDGMYCGPDTTWKIRYRQCDHDNFPEDKGGNPPLKTPANCVDWTIPDVRDMPPDTPVFYPNDPANYPRALGF